MAARELSGRCQWRFLCDSQPEVLREAARLVPGCRTGTDLRELLHEAPCDLVVMALPPDVDRSGLVKALAESSVKAVLVEKPAGLSADSVVQAYGGLTQPVWVCHQMRLLPWMQALKEWWGRQPDCANLRVELRSYGKLYDQGVHLLDLLYWLQGGRITQQPSHVLLEDEPARLAQCHPLHPGWRYDSKHPGAQWSELELQADRSSGLPGFSLKAGPLAFEGPDWLGKEIRITGGRGGLTASAAGGLRFEGEWAKQNLDYPGDASRYQEATRAVYRSLSDYVQRRLAVDEVALPRINAHVSVLRWLEGVLSVPARRLPEPAYLARTRERAEDPVSVIVPLSDHRGLGVECIRSWLTQSQVADEAYELIVISNPQTMGVAEQIRPLLRERDQLIHNSAEEVPLGQGDMIEYVMGVEASDSEFIFMSEPHCIALPDTVQQLRRAFLTTEAAGFCTDTIERVDTLGGKMESLYYEEGFESWKQPGAWEKMIMRGFGVRRSAYRAVGGLNLRYGRFCEWLLAADLHRRGYYLTYVPEVAIVHCYTQDIRYLNDAIEEFVMGQSLYLEETPLPERADYFPEPTMVQSPSDPEWGRVRRQLMGKLSVLAEALRPSGMAMARCKRDVHALLVHLLRWKRRWSFSHFKGFYESQVAYAFHKHRYPAGTSLGASTAISLAQGWDASTLQPPVGQGFYTVEPYDAQRFCWMAPIGGLPLELPAGSSVLELRLVPILKLKPECLMARVSRSGVRVTRIECLRKEARLRFHLENVGAACRIWFGLKSPRFSAMAPETRSLGIPVATIRLTTTSHTTQCDPCCHISDT